MTRRFLAIILSGICMLLWMNLPAALAQQAPVLVTAEDMQANPAPDGPTPQPDALPREGTRLPTAPGAPPAYITYKQPYEVYLTGLTIALGLGIAAILAFVGRREGLNAETSRTFIIVLVIFAVLFLMTAGYTDQQVAPA